MIKIEIKDLQDRLAKNAMAVLRWLLDYRTWLPAVFWGGLISMDLAPGDLPRAANILVLVLMAVMIFLFIRGVFDHTFLPKKNWEDLWEEDTTGVTKVAIALMYIAIAIIVASLGGAIINPFN